MRLRNADYTYQGYKVEWFETLDMEVYRKHKGIIQVTSKVTGWHYVKDFREGFRWIGEDDTKVMRSVIILEHQKRKCRK